MKFDPAFKKAISALPSSEKDKLIFRLLKKDLVLANRLLFELVDDNSIEDRRAMLEDRIVAQSKRNAQRFYSLGCLLLDVKSLSGEITEHVKVTKDKIGEISLNILLLTETIRLNNEQILLSQPNKSKTLNVYIIARAFKILLLINKMHSDMFLEFVDDLKILGNLIGNNDVLMRTAIFHGFDVNWFCTPYIPEDIVELHKELRSMGYLR